MQRDDPVSFVIWGLNRKRRRACGIDVVVWSLQPSVRSSSAAPRPCSATRGLPLLCSLDLTALPSRPAAYGVARLQHGEALALRVCADMADRGFGLHFRGAGLAELCSTVEQFRGKAPHKVLEGSIGSQVSRLRV